MIEYLKLDEDQLLALREYAETRRDSEDFVHVSASNLIALVNMALILLAMEKLNHKLKEEFKEK